MTGLQLAILGGLVVGAGLAVLLWRFAPVHADLAEALTRLTPGAGTRHVDAGPRPPALERAGAWGLRVLPPALRPVPEADLALLEVTPVGFLGQKMAFALIGLFVPALLDGIVALGGVNLPVAIPVAATLFLAAGMFLLPDLSVRQDAARAREEFVRTLAAYVDLVALERYCGSGTRQALEVAAGVSDSWVFRRLRETLAYSTWAGEPPWDGLRELAGKLAIPDLADLADIMRLSGSEGAQVYRTLRARANSMRTAMLHDDLTRANEVSEKMSIPVSVLGIVFMVILITPALLTVLFS